MGGLRDGTIETPGLSLAGSRSHRPKTFGVSLTHWTGAHTAQRVDSYSGVQLAEGRSLGAVTSPGVTTVKRDTYATPSSCHTVQKRERERDEWCKIGVKRC